MDAKGAPWVDEMARQLYHLEFECRSGEIGIRTRLKIWRGHTHVGSSPTSGTIKMHCFRKGRLLPGVIFYLILYGAFS